MFQFAAEQSKYFLQLNPGSVNISPTLSILDSRTCISTHIWHGSDANLNVILIETYFSLIYMHLFAIHLDILAIRTILYLAVDGCSLQCGCGWKSQCQSGVMLRASVVPSDHGAPPRAPPDWLLLGTALGLILCGWSGNWSRLGTRNIDYWRPWVMRTLISGPMQRESVCLH